eukprot:scaffold143_cov260-Pinguiococcus_pyrenoidosus.AAC.44
MPRRPNPRLPRKPCSSASCSSYICICVCICIRSNRDYLPACSTLESSRTFVKLAAPRSPVRSALVDSRIRFACPETEKDETRLDKTRKDTGQRTERQDRKGDRKCTCRKVHPEASPRSARLRPRQPEPSAVDELGRRRWARAS